MTVPCWHCRAQGTNDTKITAGIDWFASRRHAVTTASPLTHKLGPNGTLVSLPVGGGTRGSYTTTSLFKALRAQDVRVLPILYNDESYDITLLPKLRQLFANPMPFISQLAALAEEVGVLPLTHEATGYGWQREHCALTASRNATVLRSTTWMGGTSTLRSVYDARRAKAQRTQLARMRVNWADSLTS